LFHSAKLIKSLIILKKLTLDIYALTGIRQFINYSYPERRFLKALAGIPADAPQFRFGLAGTPASVPQF
jgi:hypothetical protein